jgi:hypothetical protein
MTRIFSGIFVAAFLALAACASHPLVTLAQRCDELAAAVNIASVHRAAGKLTPSQVQSVLASEPVAKTLCNKATPPLDPTTAIGRVADMLDQIALINSGIR